MLPDKNVYCYTGDHTSGKSCKENNKQMIIQKSGYQGLGTNQLGQAHNESTKQKVVKSYHGIAVLYKNGRSTTEEKNENMNSLRDIADIKCIIILKKGVLKQGSPNKC